MNPIILIELMINYNMILKLIFFINYIMHDWSLVDFFYLTDFGPGPAVLLCIKHGALRPIDIHSMAADIGVSTTTESAYPQSLLFCCLLLCLLQPRSRLIFGIFLILKDVSNQC